MKRLYRAAQVLLVLALVYCVFVWIERNVLAVWFQATHNDFKHLYFGALALRRGLDPYDFNILGLLAAEHFGRPVPLNPFVYPPFTGLLFIPLTAWPMDVAARVWQVANHLFFLGSIGLVLWAIASCRSCYGSLKTPALVTAFVFALALMASIPSYRNLSAGQLNGILLLLIALALAAEARRRPVLACVFLGIAAMVKLTPGILLLHYLLRRDWKAAGAFFGTLLVLALLSLVFVPLETHLEFLPLMAEMGYGSSTNASLGEAFHTDVYNQAPSALWYRLFTDQTGFRAGTMGLLDAPGLAKALSYLTALVIIGLTALVSWRLRDRREARVFALGLWTFPMLLGPSLMWDHYLVLLTPMLMLLAAEVVRQRRTWAWLALGIPLVIVQVPWPFDHPAFKSGLAVAAISAYTLVPLLLYLLALRLGSRFSHEHETPAPA